MGRRSNQFNKGQKGGASVLISITTLDTHLSTEKAMLRNGSGVMLGVAKSLGNAIKAMRGVPFGGMEVGEVSESYGGF